MRPLAKPSPNGISGNDTQAYKMPGNGGSVTANILSFYN